MSADGAVLAESRGGEGMLHCVGAGFAPVLSDHLARLGAPIGAPVLICGMAGARQGAGRTPPLRAPPPPHAPHPGATPTAPASPHPNLPPPPPAPPPHPAPRR